MTRFEPELVAENATTFLEDAERIGLPTGPVQREHSSPEEVRAADAPRRGFELDDHALVTAERELEIEPPSITASRSSDSRVIAAAANSS